MSVLEEKSHIITAITSLDGEEIQVNNRDVDQALEYALHTKGLIIDVEKERKLVRKIDWYIMPIMVALMSCQLMDKTTNSYAAIMGLRTDIVMSGAMYSWVGSSFYFGYLVFELPANMLLQKFPLSKTLAIIVALWGIILMCHAACVSYAPFIVCRVLLGFCESAMNPAYIMLTSQWYKKEEQFMRSAIWFGFQGFGTLLGAGTAYGLATHQANYSLPAWKLLYIITGIITIFLAIIAYVHVPDLPTKAWFLSEEEKNYCVERIRDNQQGFGNRRFKKHQAIEALLDIRTWIFFFYGMSYAIPNGGFNNFGSILLNQDFGFSSTTSLLMNMPGGGIDIIIPFVAAWIQTRWIKSRLVVALICNSITLLGMCLLAFTKPKGSRLFGYYTFYIATAVIACMISCISSNTAGHTKKVVVNTIFLIGYCTGNIVGPQTFSANQAPGYAGAKSAMVVSFAAAELMIVLMIYLNLSENKRRDRKVAELGDKYAKVENSEFADLTDKENPEFRYSI